MAADSREVGLKPIRRALLVLAVAVVTPAACSSNGDSGTPADAPGVSAGAAAVSGKPPVVSGDEKTAADRIAQSFLGNSNELPVSDAEANCVGARVVRALGLRRVNQIDFSADTLPLSDDNEAHKVAKAVIACVDMRRLLVANIVGAAKISESSARCVGQSLTDAQLEDVLVAGFLGRSRSDIGALLIAPMTKAMGDCLTSAEMGALRGGS